MKTKTLLKFYKNSCGPCGMMSRYDFKVAAEEGLNFIKVQVNGPDYETWKPVLWQLYPNGRGCGWPTYILIDGDTPTSNIIGHFRGGMDKGKFRGKLKAFEVEEEVEEEALPWIYDGDKLKGLPYGYVTRGLPPLPFPENGACGNTDFHWQVVNQSVTINPGETFHAGAKTGGCDADTSKKCNNGLGKDNIQYQNFFEIPAGSGNWMSGGIVDGTNENQHIPTETPGVYPWNLMAWCQNSNERGSNDCCGNASMWSNSGATVTILGPVDPCNPNPCGWNETCFNQDGTAVCRPNDPCEGVNCGPCETCRDGRCESTCGPGQICEGGVCKDPAPSDPCEGVTCGPCEQCVNGTCESTCAPGQICDGGVCKDPPPGDPCDGIDCGPCQQCEGGVCVDTCPDCHTCDPDNNICVDQCVGGSYCDGGVCVCPDGEEMDDNGNCVPEVTVGPCFEVLCTGGKSPQETDCDENGENCLSCDCVCPEGMEEDLDGNCYVPPTDPIYPPDESGEGRFIPRLIAFQCCPTCPDLPPEFEEGDNGDCDGRPEADPVPGADEKERVYLYDRLNHTYQFCSDIYADVTWLLKFNVLPPVFQRYVSTAAAVRAAAQMVDNPQLFQLLKDREQMLRMACSNYELEQGDLNYLGQPDHTTYYGYQPFQTLQR